MKKKFNISESGSIMIEALAMLALIAMVTPILYKKTAERTTELQDINIAGEIRSLIKAADDYVAANYDKITGEDEENRVVENSCEGHTSIDYGDFDLDHDTKEINIGHLCEFLPYGVLDDEGNLKDTKLFDGGDVRLTLKMKGTAGEDGDRIVTSFITANPKSEELPTMRASSIASLIGGNGGYVADDEKIQGNLGIWEIANPEAELGVSDLKKGAIVAASIEGVSAQNAKLDLDDVLFRNPKSNPDLNTMSTDLLMSGGNKDAGPHGIKGLRDLAVGADDAGGNALYIARGDITIGGDGEGTGNINVNNGNVSVANGRINVGGDGGSTLSNEEITIGDNFSAASDGVVNAISYIAGDDVVQINVDDRTAINQPLEVEADEECDGTKENCILGLHVKGSEIVEGDLTVRRTFSAKDLHAQENLTVGGPNPNDHYALEVKHTGGENNPGTNTFKFTGGNGGSFSVETGEGAKTGKLNVNSGSVDVTLRNDGRRLRHSSLATGYTITADSDEGAAEYRQRPDQTTMVVASSSGQSQMTMTPANIQAYSGEIMLNNNAFVIDSQNIGASNQRNDISSVANLFKVDVDPDNYVYFRIGERDTDSWSPNLHGNQVKVRYMPLDLQDSALMLFDSHIMLQKEAGEGIYKNVIAVHEGGTMDNTQIDITGEGMLMKSPDTTHTAGDNNSENVLKIDLRYLDTTNNPDSNHYPVYIRKGAIELKAPEDGYENYSPETSSYRNYVQADRFVANHKIEDKALVDKAGGDLVGDDTRYEVNPAYTSVMHDIKLTTRGGARLSDILPDFINRGIYIVDNTFPARGYECHSHVGKKLSEYKQEGAPDDYACDNFSDEASPWAGFVPTPTCPPGYSKVITLVPASFAMAQAGIPRQKTFRDLHSDLVYNIPVLSPWDFTDPDNPGDEGNEPTPLYYQKNTWLKSFVETCYKASSSSGCATSDTNSDNFKGWNVGMGFAYPYATYWSDSSDPNVKKGYLNELGENGSGGNVVDVSGSNSGGEDTRIAWNIFPVNVGSLEGYATVYCYFDRGRQQGGEHFFNHNLVDVYYDQLNNPRGPNARPEDINYNTRLNPTNPDAPHYTW